MKKMLCTIGLALVLCSPLFSTESCQILSLDSIPSISPPSGIWLNFGRWSRPIPRYDDDYNYHHYLDAYRFHSDSLFTRYSHNTVCPRIRHGIYQLEDTLMQTRHFDEYGEFVRWKRWGLEYKNEELMALHENPRSPDRAVYMYRKVKPTGLANPDYGMLLDTLRNNTFYHRGEEILIDDWMKKSSLHFLNDSTVIQTTPYEDFSLRDWRSKGNDYQDTRHPYFRTLRFVIDSDVITGELFLLIAAHKPIQISGFSQDSVTGYVYTEQFDSISLIKDNYDRHSIDFFGTWSLEKPIESNRSYADCLEETGAIQFMHDTIRVTPKDGITLTYKCSYLNNALLHLELEEDNTALVDEFWGREMIVFQQFREEQRMGIYVRKKSNERREPNHTFLFLKK